MASTFRPGKLSHIEILIRLFPTQKKSVLDLVLQGCNGDVVKAIEHLLSASEPTINENKNLETNRMVSTTNNSCPKTEEERSTSPCLKRTGSPLPEAAKRLRPGNLLRAWNPAFSPASLNSSDASASSMTAMAAALNGSFVFGRNHSPVSFSLASSLLGSSLITSFPSIANDNFLTRTNIPSGPFSPSYSSNSASVPPFYFPLDLYSSSLTKAASITKETIWSKLCA